jgi:exoribonuclease R
LRAADAAELQRGFEQIRVEVGVPQGFPPEVLAAADAVASAPVLPWPDLDLTDVPFATLDPLGSRDLDQAYFVERRPAPGYRVRYAIADVAAFVAPDGPLDLEAHRRVETVYAPDERLPLHPPVLSEGAASLLPGEVRPAVVWTFDLDAHGQVTTTDVRRARVRSREQQEYVSVQAALDAGTAPEPVALLREVGRLRQEAQRERGGMTLNAPEQQVVDDGHGGYALALRSTLPIEDWNAQLSLMTGMGAASLMLSAGVGVLRTMPPADPRDVERLRRVAKGLGLAWPDGVGYAELLAGLDPTQPRAAAFLTEATSLFRGAGYTVVDGAAGAAPHLVEHAAIAAPYTHCTAPLRRLVDRYASEVALAVCAGVDVPDRIRAALPELPHEMAVGDQRAHHLERADLDLVEAALLAPRVGQTFDAVVVDLDERHGGGTVQLADPAVLARCDASHGPLVLGSDVRVRLVEADVAQRLVRFVNG